MPKRKGKVNLTIAADARERAEKLAKKQRRSISTLFEKLVDEEWERSQTREEPDSAYGRSGKDKDKPRRKIGFLLKPAAIMTQQAPEFKVIESALPIEKAS